MANGFDIATVWAEDKRPVIIWMVDFPDPRRTVVGAPSIERRFVERSDLFSVLRLERNVHRSLLPGAFPEPEIRFASPAESCPPLSLHDKLYS